MATNPVSTSNMWPNYSKGNVSNKSGNGQELGKDQFLSILITQLRNQDPLQPMQDREFIAQMAQFTSLEQLMNINTQLTAMSQSLGAASSLIGKQISWMSTPEDGSETIMKSGVVESIIVREGIHYAQVGGSEVALDEILKIENAVIEKDTEVPYPKPAEPTSDPNSAVTETGEDPEAVNPNPNPTKPETSNPDVTVPETEPEPETDTENEDPGQVEDGFGGTES
ncbi:flagellar hook capping FlgD N-terminal domain-containing protein [Paenibacillus solani]|uniref:flagellar hook capping FlgD N-terminal domain-containing protein n=1 Tax=Paenibacillus solani TaxID=1705565 RepID=UPI0009E8A7B1|nr:flagellar hook capping FlgD N-terminal domain-containing protein [Paenibacillus solani]